MNDLKASDDLLSHCRNFWLQKYQHFRAEEGDFSDHLSTVWQLLDELTQRHDPHGPGSQAAKEAKILRSDIEGKFSREDFQRRLKEGEELRKRMAKSEKTILKSWTYGSKGIAIFFQPEKPFSRDVMQALARISKLTTFDEARNLLQEAIEERVDRVERNGTAGQTSGKKLLCPADIRAVDEILKRQTNGRAQRSRIDDPSAAYHGKATYPHRKRRSCTDLLSDQNSQTHSNQDGGVAEDSEKSANRLNEMVIRETLSSDSAEITDNLSNTTSSAHLSEAVEIPDPTKSPPYLPQTMVDSLVHLEAPPAQPRGNEDLSKIMCCHCGQEPGIARDTHEKLGPGQRRAQISTGTLRERVNTSQQQPEDENSYEDDENEVSRYLEIVELFAQLRREQKGDGPDTVFDEATRALTELRGAIAQHSNAHSRRRVDRVRAKQLYQQSRPPAVIIVRDAFLRERFSHKTFRGQVAALERSSEKMSAVNMAKEATAKDAWSGSLMGTASLVEALQQRQQANRMSYCVSNASIDSFIPPYNSLNLRCSEDNVWPDFLLLDDRYRLLKTLDEDLLMEERATKRTKRSSTLSAEKAVRRFERVVDFAACQGFTLLSQADAISLTHRDHHGQGTVVRVAAGKKLWVWFEDLTEGERVEFGRNGPSWIGQRPSWALLSPGDILIMRAGAAIPHFVVTLEDSLCFGGAFWDECLIPDILDAIHEEQTVPGMITTNEGLTKQLPDMLVKLEQRINDNDGHHGFSAIEAEQLEARFRMIEAGWGCRSCTEGCSTRCPCRRWGGCTPHCPCSGGDVPKQCWKHESKVLLEKPGTAGEHA